MKNKEMIIRIADFLDKSDKVEEADFMDSLLQEELDEGMEVEIPEEELNELQRVFESLKESLGGEKV